MYSQLLLISYLGNDNNNKKIIPLRTCFFKKIGVISSFLKNGKTQLLCPNGTFCRFGNFIGKWRYSYNVQKLNKNIFVQVSYFNSYLNLNYYC